jgi:hypothetical protein
MTDPKQVWREAGKARDKNYGDEYRKPHIHAELIKAWADGAEIEVQHKTVWLPATCPTWQVETKYRVKPEPHKWQKEMDAYAAGKTIQWRYRSEWRDCDEWGAGAPLWITRDGHDYRIKPELVVYTCLVNKGVGLYSPKIVASVQGEFPISATWKPNIKLTFEDGVLAVAEVLKC